jgi:hypothetical protein
MPTKNHTSTKVEAATTNNHHQAIIVPLVSSDRGDDWAHYCHQALDAVAVAGVTLDLLEVPIAFLA